MESWLESFSSNGGNYIRVWVSSPFRDIEHEKGGVYDEAKARRIGRLLELCEKHGIRVKLTLQSCQHAAVWRIIPVRCQVFNLLAPDTWRLAPIRSAGPRPGPFARP